MTHHNSYEFTLKPTWRGYVLMYRESVPDCAPGMWRWGRWRRAAWKDMPLFRPENLK